MAPWPTSRAPPWEPGGPKAYVFPGGKIGNTGRKAHDNGRRSVPVAEIIDQISGHPRLADG